MTLLRLLGVFLRIGSMNELAYRANFWVQTFESVVQGSVSLGAVAVVFSQTDELGGWRRPELLVLLGIYFIIAGMIRLVIGPSFSRFMEHVQQGTLDFTLTKPADAQMLVSIEVIQIWKLLDVVLGIGVLALGAIQLAERVGPAEAVSFVVALLCSGAIVYSFWLFLATLSFWFIRIENILMVLWGVYGAGRWPIQIYPQWLRVVLTFLVPIAFAVTVPAQAFAGRLDQATLAGAVALAVAMLVASRAFWKIGVRHYAGASA